MAPATRFPVVFYAASLTMASLSLSVTWLYALRFGKLVDERLDRRTVDQETARSLATAAVFLVSIGAAAFGLGAALACWLLPVSRVLIVRQASRLS
jgi:hypothetical protein